MCREKTTGEILAVKILKKDMKIAHALTESKTLQKISHPFLAVRLLLCLLAPIYSPSLFAESQVLIPDC